MRGAVCVVVTVSFCLLLLLLVWGLSRRVSRLLLGGSSRLGELGSWIWGGVVSSRGYSGELSGWCL